MKMLVVYACLKVIFYNSSLYHLSATKLLRHCDQRCYFFGEKTICHLPTPPPFPTPTTTTTFSFNVAFIVIPYKLFGQNNIGELKQQLRRRLQKRHLKREFVPPQILSRLFHLV